MERERFSTSRMCARIDYGDRGSCLALLLSYLFKFSHISLNFDSFFITKEGVGLDQGFHWVPRNGIRRSLNP